MTIAVGVAKQVKYKVESVWGTVPVAASAQALRRVTSDLDLQKDTFQSNEIRADYQVADMRHGMRSVSGTINGELSPKTYADFFGAAMRRDFAAVSSLTALSITIAASGSNYTLTRAAGSYLTDGVKVGQVVRLTAGSFTAGNLNNNLLVMNVTALVLTVAVVNGSNLTAEGPIASATLAIPGKYTYIPTTGHVDRSYSIEHWYADIAQSEVFSGCKVSQIDVQMPATGMATCAVAFMGKDVTPTASEYFTTPTAQTSTGALAAVNGALFVAGTKVANVTGLNFTINNNMTQEAVVGSNYSPDIFEGRVTVSGQLTAFFEDATLRNLFVNETTASLMVTLTTAGDNNADFVAVAMTKVKVGGASKDDGEKGIIQTLPFTALLDTSGGTGAATQATTISIQDSAA